jgi:hypothetical protein
MELPVILEPLVTQALPVKQDLLVQQDKMELPVILEPLVILALQDLDRISVNFLSVHSLIHSFL